MQDVAQRRAGGRGDHPDPAGQPGQGLLVAFLEQAFGGEFLLQCLEPATQRTFPGFLEVLDHDLELAPGLVDADPAAGQHEGPVTQREADQHVALPEHRAADLCRLVLEREIPVPGGGARKVGYLTFEPYRAQCALEQHPRLPVEAADGENLARGQ